jgi:Lrp/AsnC family leucine-responsive transcriptional regulator
MQSSRESETRRLDETDRRILRALQRDARLTTAQLAEQVGLSTTPCWNRLKRLETAGYIEGYVAILSQGKLGLPDTVLIEVTLDRADSDILERVARQFEDIPEVLEAYLITGEYDYLIKVAVDGTSGYERFLREKLYRIQGIRHSRSYFAVRCIKRQNSVQA